MQSALEWRLGPGLTRMTDGCIIVRDESCVDACQYFPGSAVLVRTYGSVFPSCVFPFSVLLALPYLPALGGLLSPESNALCSLLCVPIKMTLFPSPCLTTSQGIVGDFLRVEWPPRKTRVLTGAPAYAQQWADLRAITFQASRRFCNVFLKRKSFPIKALPVRVRERPWWNC